MNEKGLEIIRDEEDEDVGHLKDLASEAPIIKLVNLLITRAVEARASDIHIEPFEDELKVRYRIDGVLHEVESAPKRLQAAMSPGSRSWPSSISPSGGCPRTAAYG